MCRAAQLAELILPSLAPPAPPRVRETNPEALSHKGNWNQLFNLLIDLSLEMLRGASQAEK
jgi:hypothetical protein